MQYEKLVELYGAKTDDELLRLRLGENELTHEASLALNAVLLKRGIASSDRLSSFRKEEEKRTERLSKNPGNLFCPSVLVSEGGTSEK